MFQRARNASCNPSNVRDSNGAFAIAEGFQSEKFAGFIRKLRVNSDCCAIKPVIGVSELVRAISQRLRAFLLKQSTLICFGW